MTAAVTEGMGAGVEVGLFWRIHKSGISQMPALRIDPGDSQEAANAISRAAAEPGNSSLGGGGVCV